MKFQIQSDYQPSGDQPAAIDGLCNALSEGVGAVTLLGVTGSGKTFTMANVIQRLQRRRPIFRRQTRTLKRT